MTPKKRAPAKKAPAEVEAPIKVASTRADDGPGTALAVRTAMAGALKATGTTHQIQTTMQPSVTITVGEAEYQYLFSQGLIWNGTAPLAAPDFYDGEIADRIANGSATPQALATAAAGSGPFGSGLKAAYLPRWAPSTAYTAGDVVVNPSGQIVSANSSFTSGTTYNAGNWAVAAGGTSVTDNGDGTATAA